ncbi:protein SPT2 homolog [Sipha flava]|uniref:Protein SPT2 homolog n=1 Tax=Sipha flava TaxID=143950 RepID=A0A8B8GL60_9HEMI|nr:protein SPT2 homolog [Sipha flava]XP_025423985.1 protein SPT2 homolog [Sipha flava]
MDFHTILYQAQKNNTRDNEVKYFKASLDPPKKVTKESRQLSESIKKFLAKKEEEDRQKQLEEQKKKDELISLRSQDRKSFKRVQSMLNRTKSANKSVIEDAKDDVNTSVTMAGFHQPDEDDYGYVSKDAMDIYNNIINKYVNTPADSRSSKTVNHKSHDISGTKDRVKAALLKEEEDQLLPHKRKRKPKELENMEDNQVDPEPQQKNLKSDTDKIKKRPMQPPPLNFQELLKIAEKKQHEPIIIEKPKKEESLPMMTKKEREKYLEEKRIETMRNARRQGKIAPSTENPKEVRPIEKVHKPIASSSKVDLNAENKLKKNASVWTKDLKIHKELNNNSKNDKYVPRSLNNSESVGFKSNSGNKSIPKTTLESNSYNDKKYSSNDERYSPKPKSINDKYIPKPKHTIQEKYLPKSKGISNRDQYVPKSSNDSYEKYSPKPKNFSHDKYSSKPTSTEKYEPRAKILTNEKYLSKLKSQSELYSPKARNEPEKYVPKGKSSSSTELYTPSAVKRSVDRYSPKPTSSQSLKSKSISSKDKYVPTPVNKSKNVPPNNNVKPKQFPPKDIVPKQFPPKDMVPKHFPPRDMVPKQFPPRDLVPKQFPPPDMRRRDDRNMPMRNKRRVIESDSDEYDSELDDFIDDGPEEGAEDYSKVISEIFKYDKSKYRGIDEDDECMESDFRTLQKEEYRSSRAGLLEDLADIRREKAMMKRRKRN